MDDVFAAILSGDLHGVKRYVTTGNDINARNSDEFTPLMLAAAKGHLRMVDFLLEHGADPTLCDSEGYDALWAAYESSQNVAICLLLVKKLAFKKGYIETLKTDDLDVTVNKLITTLLYKNNRHHWHSRDCINLQHYIGYLRPEFDGKDRSFYDRHISKAETDNRDFYGSYASDDSDSEDEIDYQRQKQPLQAQDRLYIERAQVAKLTYKISRGDKKKGDFKPIKNGSSMFNLPARSTIHYSKGTNEGKIRRDLNYLNLLLSRKTDIEAALREADSADRTFTKFFVAEYRGITYLTTKWNQASRKAHRNDPNEIGRPQYSSSVLAASRVGFFRTYAESAARLANNALEVNQQAALLREILLTLREPKPYSYQSYTYTNLAYLLQNIYTQDYDGFHKLIKTHPVLTHLLLNDSNPFLSMGDTPYHGEKYAYGIKPYKGHEHFRLRPRWRADGRAERPHSGVVYASLHPLTDFTQDGPLHLISLNHAAEIKLNDELTIIAERETCFPAYLPEQRVFYKQKAKYPSFSGEYKGIFLAKYGLTSELYYKFKAKLEQARPHTEEMREFKKLLGEWLCSFHEVKMIDLARQAAEERGGVLIYRGTNGTFSLTPPIDSVNRHSRAITPEVKIPVKNKQKHRAGQALNSDNIELLTEYFSDLSIKTPVSEFGEKAFTEVNAGMSMPFSLLVSAVSHRYDLALAHFLGKAIFSQEVNTRFNTKELTNITLLHLAVLKYNHNALKRLLTVQHTDLNAVATRLVNGNYSYIENITPLSLAMENNSYWMAAYLIKQGAILSDNLKMFTDTIDADFRDYLLRTDNPINDQGVSAEVFELLMVLKACHPALLEQRIVNTFNEYTPH